jgi:hypothetical protein
MSPFYRNPMMLLCAPLAALSLGCGTAATITRVDSPPLEGKIVASADDILQVETKAGNTPVAMQSVSDIDHPGNVAGTIGALVTAYGAYNIYVGMPQCERQGGAFCVGVFLPAAIGLPLTIWGFTTWGRSKVAASQGSKPSDVAVTVLPTAAFEKNNTFVGASATVTY